MSPCKQEIKRALPSSMHMIQINNASIVFGEEVLFSKQTFHIDKGTMACITGVSGTGKSSLLNAVMGFVPLQEGEIVVDGVSLSPSTIDGIRRKIAWMPQELALPAEWVSEMITVPFELKQNRKKYLSEKEDGSFKRRLMDAWMVLGLEPELYDKRVREISGGQRQRMMIAAAALLNKEVLIVDEPTSALDPASVDRILLFFHHLKASGMTILAVSHDSRYIAGCDTVFKLTKTR